MRLCKNKMFAVLMAAVTLCTAAVSFAGALEDRRVNLPKEFTEGRGASVDVNGDNKVDIEDMIVVLQYMFQH